MHICIIGTGASGWIVCAILKKLEFVKKITIIGSSKIPSIGVGESTTLNFVRSVLDKIDLKQFVEESDAAVKYGVYYKNWSKKDYIHYFKSEQNFARENHQENTWGKTLANKELDTHIHDLVGNKLWNFIQKNEVSLNFKEYPHSWHFDAGKFIQFLKKISLKDEKVNFIDDTIIDCKFLMRDQIHYIVGEKKKKYTADYFVNCCGDNKLNEKIFKEEYMSLSSYLLTNKAIVYPLNYKNKRDQFHPYTISKTMKCGWRWITPTQSRIGTGYVFSDKHISIDEATNEFVEDVGDKTIQPFVVDFIPKYNKKTFKKNSCTIGMSNGFLEPLDAPGLHLSILGISLLSKLLELKNDNSTCSYYKDLDLEKVNNTMKFETEWWCSFILHQYKTCWRDDTQFWMDQKKVNCNFYNEIISLLNNVPDHIIEKREFMMFYFTTAAKDIQWTSNIKQKPFPIEQLDTETIHHLEYIQRFYN